MAFDTEMNVWLVGRAHLVRVRDALVGKHGAFTVLSDNRFSQHAVCDSLQASTTREGWRPVEVPQTHDDG